MPCSATRHDLEGTTCISGILEVGIGVEVATTDPPATTAQADKPRRIPVDSVKNLTAWLKRIALSIFEENV